MFAKKEIIGFVLCFIVISAVFIMKPTINNWILDTKASLSGKTPERTLDKMEYEQTGTIMPWNGSGNQQQYK
jgi:hypothetical protein